MTDLGWFIFGSVVLALVAIEVARACRRARRREIDPSDEAGA